MSTFVSEPITPVLEAGSAGPARIGEPILPAAFVWRAAEYRVESVLKQWKESGPCRSGSTERYVRKHWYRVRMTDGVEMEIYFECQARSSSRRKRRWWLFTVTDEEQGE